MIELGSIVKYNDDGLIEYIDISAPVNMGASICNDCGKTMPKIWDVVCYFCHRTFCYDCSMIVGNFWSCRICRVPVKPEEMVNGRLLRKLDIQKEAIK